MHFVYILFNIETKKFYIGRTNNINKRLKEHRAGVNKSTKFKCYAWRLVCAEIYKSEKDAAIREKKLKAHGSGLVELKKRIKYSILIN